NFFLRSSMLDCLNLRLRALELCLRPCRLTAGVGIIELKERLSLANVVAFLHEKPTNGGVRRGVRFEILCRFDFAIGRNDAADGTALNGGGADWNYIVAHRVERSEQDDCQARPQRDDQPALPPEEPGFVLVQQCHERSFTSNNLPPRTRSRALQSEAWYGPFRCAPGHLG